MTGIQRDIYSYISKIKSKKYQKMIYGFVKALYDDENKGKETTQE